MIADWQKNNKYLGLVIGLIFLTSLIYSFGYQIRPAVDAKAYHSIAVNILSGHGFRESATGDILFDRSIQRAGPAYEYFLAGLYGLFGIHYEVAWVAQALLHALSAWLLYKICSLVFEERGRKIGLIAALIFGFHPDLVEISAMLMTETFYLFLTILSLYFFIKVYVERNWQWTIALATTLAVGILARPPLILFIPIIGWLYFVRKQWTFLVLFVTVLIVCLTPWTVRNYRVYDQFIPTTLIGEYNLWVGNTLRADGGQLSGGYNPFDEYAAKYGYTSIHSVASQEFKSFIIEHPTKFVELTIVRTIRYFSLIRPMGFWFYQIGWSQLIFVGFSTLAIAGLFILGLAGLIQMYKAKKSVFNYFIALTASAPILLLPTVVQSRYRFQIYPFLAIAAAYLIITYCDDKKWWRSQALIASLIILGSISIIDVFLSAEMVIDRIKGFLL